MRTTLLAVAVAGAVLLTGCTKGVEHVSGVAAPAVPPSATSAAPTTPPPSSSPSPSSPSAPPATSKSSKPSTPKVIGPTGYGALKLGMTRDEATATGLITRWAAQPDTNCPWRARLKQTVTGTPSPVNDVYWNKDGGIAAIVVHGTIHTPEGIRIGSTYADVMMAYNNWQNAADPGVKFGHGTVDVPGNNDAVYRLDISRDGKVTSVALQSKKYGCYE
ncbi:hypothetical protein JIG36_20105 [Actinoplanes sp. LDG1-06]|uniref:Uncharacterized protein n=1 Tax=Paractinoplanes ovalisporus TaxID=2810368 RepID=A0ABS2ADG2_9ACTN|nr:hypothetical protein [Actinoplanes ovalisporus]MBM2617864.1 hypothetical protein [Actinoplanes ovalisporus]